MTKVLILDGHPSKKSLSDTLSLAVASGAKGKGHEAKIFRISEMDFEPDLHNGHHTAQTLEADIVAFQEALTWADTLVLVHPLWWGGPPAKLKALLDRALLPDFAFRFLPGKSIPEKLLTGKAAHLILTSDSPAWYLKWLANGWVKTLNQQILGYCGFSKTKVTYIGPVRSMDEKGRKKAEQTASSLFK